ncbi:MAG: hypothetical protein QNK24_05755 [Desulfuromusa sp.]|nr:hypothetical protein [Desulfuromusa sp.]
MDLSAELIRRSPHLLLRFVLALAEIKNRKIRKDARHGAKIPPLGSVGLVDTKNSDTVFLLGSGSSINEISEEKWSQIAKFDSFGLNFTVCLPFVPTHYFFEACFEEVTNVLFQFYEKRGEDYSGVLKILSASFPTSTEMEYRFVNFPEPWSSNIYSAGVYRTVTRTESELVSEIGRLKKLGVFDIGRSHVNTLFKHMGSVSSLITLAGAMSYKNIVLCGFDITNPAYFYDDVERYPDMERYATKVRPKLAQFPSNRSALQTPGSMVIMELKKQVLDPAGIHLYVENSLSGLYPEVELAPDSLYETQTNHL